MRKFLSLCLISLSWGAPQQYSGDQTGALDAGSLDTIAEIFGTSGKQVDDGYGSGQTGALSDDVNVLVQVIQESNEYPNDYVPETASQVVDKATVEVNTDFENCADYTELLGYECVPYYQCHNGTIITDGAGLIDIRNGFGSLTPEDSKCPGFLDVCCKDPDFIPPPPPKIKFAPQCGRRNQNGLGVRIQGFTESESQFGEWPHMCAILHEKPIEQEGGYSGEPQTVNLYQCGGSLIAPGVILTAAHCVDKFRQNPAELKIRCGEWDTQNQTEPYPHQDRYVQALNIHPQFDGRNLQNDFAVLFTSEDFVLSSHIDTVCLPQAEEIFDGTTCFATGWGKDKFGSAGQYQVVLKEIDLPVVSNYECQDKLRSTRLGQKYKLHDSFICAGGVNGKDTCKGDGGSPLVCPSKYDPNTYVQAGMVAWGIGCGEDGTPGVYASVSKALCWIDYAMSCHYGDSFGDYNSYNGYTSNVCQDWMDNKIADLERKRDGAGKYGRIFEAQIQGFRQCTVNWEAPSAPLVDVSVFERKPEQDYGNTETKSSQTDAYADTKADQADGSYSDDSSAVKITQTYTEDNSELVSSKDTDSYSQDTSADIIEAKSPEPVY
eukprot:GFUD01004531.1.p1 GENE.GFUD01004531.1~~GFUD01004531.1.p1  ORF type:complete len:604 (+),score=187.63 GFUD01004531.1:355-2166(+)